MAERLGDLLIFVSIVAVLLVVGLLLGMLVAGRIDKLMAPAPKPAADQAEAPPAVPDPDPDPVQDHDVDPAPQAALREDDQA